MSYSSKILLACLSLFMTAASHAQEAEQAQLSQQVADTERAFARSMAERDHEAFKSFLDEETVFFSGEAPLRGSAQVAAAWKAFYEGEQPPFSWEPKTVEVLDSGTLALSSGPVHDPEGNRIATFTSIWRLDESGQWKIIFDKGNRACPDAGAGAAASTEQH
jgi:ketosteroid isomerase-like protein